MDVKFSGSTLWVRCGLTNYHVLRACLDGYQVETVQSPDGTQDYPDAEPPAGSVLAKADLRGFMSAKPEKVEHLVTPVSSPSLVRITRRIGELEAQLRVLDQQYALNPFPAFFSSRLPLVKEISTCQNIIRSRDNIFGYFVLASGDKDHGNLDWALISSLATHRVGENRLPGMDVWLEKYDYAYVPWFWACDGLLGPPVQRLCDMQPGDLVYKVGWASGATVGICSGWLGHAGLPTPCPRPPYMGLLISSAPEKGGPGTFARSGDSGSAVWDRGGHLVGLLWGAGKVGNTVFAAVIPIEDVFADILRVSGGKITDIRVRPQK